MMDPVIDNEWLSCKNDQLDETQNVGNITRSWQSRELGIDPNNYPPNKTVLENIAEDILVKKPLKIRCCDLPGYPRSTFLMVFSPDGTKLASTHGNHNVYVSELASGKHVRILKGHPRTPWCIAFHPSHTQLIGSGCLAGQVRVWDISSGGSEVWNVRNETGIASLAFHPREQLLVIATYNELYFWDWSQPAPFTKVSTNNIHEKVRYVAFDSLGYKLITGISLWTGSGGATGNSVLHHNPVLPQTHVQTLRRAETEDNQDANRSQENSGTAQDMIVDSYHNLVQRYDSLVRNYQRLFMVRHQLNNTPPPPSMIDRGTDPMETDTSSNSQNSHGDGPSASEQQNDDNPTPGPSRRLESHDSGEGDVGSSRLLNLDVLSFGNSRSRNQRSTTPEHSIFGSRSSAFQPLGDSPERRRALRDLELNARASRLLPNPFSSSSSTRLSRSPFPNSPMLSSSNTSRTRIFAPTRQRRRSISPPQLNFDGLAAAAPGNDDNSQPRPSTSSPLESQPSTSEATADRSPTAANANHCQVDAQTINESLDLIRDILRDSGTRLLNLITNMSLSTLASVERNASRRGGASRAQSEEAERGGRARAPRPRLFSSSVRRVFLSSSSDSDSDQSLEVNIFRTRNVTFNENNSDAPSNSAAAGSTIGNSNSHAPSNSNAPSSSTTRSSSTTPSNSNATGSSATGSSAATSSSTGTGSSAATSSSASTSISTATCSSTDPRNSSGPSSSTASQCQSDRPTQSADRLEFELSEESQNDLPRDSNSINVSLSNSRFRVRNHKPPSEPGPSDGAGSSNQPEPDADNRPSEPRPSTSRDDFWNSGNVVPPDEAYRKVRGGVNALHKHTVQLTNLWLRGNRVTMRELRTMWDNLRRRILMLHRETGRQDLPSYYTRSLFERCMMLTELSDSVSRTSPRNLRSNPRTENAPRSETQDISVETSNANSNAQGDNDQNDAAENTNSPRPSTSGRSSQTRSSILSTPSMRRRIQANYRWRPEDELRRRTRNPNRITPRYCGRPRRDFARAIELSATRHEIRMRAMQVLSVMFNMMMMCLEERGLSLLIINMLRTLKKALALTCLMLMTNRNAVRGSGNIPGPSMNQRSEPLNVVRIQNADHSEPVNVDDPDDNDSNSQPTTASSECKRTQPSSKQSKTADTSMPSTSQAAVTETRQRASIPQSLASQRWSNRLAVQIAAANRNYSSTARNRRELYIETKRLKVLHRTNPLAYPMMKKRALPPISTHKIPALRFMPTRSKIVRPNARANDTSNNSNQEPVAGPSREAPAENSNEESPRLMNAYEQRVNLIRIAQMHAVRLRNVTRNRFRRLQNIRLYTPSSLRDMYEFQSNNGENPQEGRSPQNESDGVSRRPFVSYRPHILAQRIDRPADDRGQFHAVLNNVAMPLMQVNDMPVNQEGQGGPTQRLPRIHEYLQPIILAQNAMVVDDENGGEGGGGGGGGVPGPRLRHIAGMAGLLDAGMISDQPPNPHRIQAWDFSAAATPDIADSTKNVVVQKCRIHNDASIDISKDGRLLVALLPVPRLRNANHWLGVYSLEWSRLGQCLHTAALEQSAVSLALSPTGRHLAVGLGSRRFTSAPHARSNVFALLFRLQRPDSASRTGLSPIKELEQNWEHGSTSLNCLRWAPQPGQGLVYANNTGQLIIMS